MRHAQPMKGRTVVGHAPLPGHPRDAEGRLILDWLYAVGAPSAPGTLASPPPATVTPPKVSRGVRAVDQGNLL